MQDKENLLFQSPSWIAQLLLTEGGRNDTFVWSCQTLSCLGIDFTGQLPCISILIRSSSAGGVEQETASFPLRVYILLSIFYLILLPNRHVDYMQESRWHWKSHRDEDSAANAYCPSHTHMSKKALIALRKYGMLYTIERTDIQKRQKNIIPI